MTSTRSGLAYIFLVIAESSWLFAAGGVLGLAFGLPRSPLNLLAVLGLLTGSTLLSLALNPVKLPLNVVRGLQVTAGATAIYLTMTTQLAAGAEIDLLWVSALSQRVNDLDYLSYAILGSVFSLGLWWWGTRLAVGEPPEESLKRSFRVGIAVIAVAAVVDAASSFDLKIPMAAFPFFGASLAGLAISHVVAPIQTVIRGGRWTQTIGGAIASILGIGLVLTLLRGDYVASFVSAIGNLLTPVINLLFSIILIPISYVASFLIRALLNLVESIYNEPDTEALELAQQGALEIANQNTQNAVAGLIGDVILWSFVALLGLGALYLMARAFRRRRFDTRARTAESRESLWRDAQPREDLSSLLLGLLPQNLRSVRRRHALQLPDDERGIVEAFRAYFRLLGLMSSKGYPRDHWQTPTEFQGTVQRFVPQSTTKLATDVFARACYGHIPATDEELETLNSSLAALEKAQKKR